MNSALRNGCLHLNFVEEEAALKILPSPVFSSHKKDCPDLSLKHFQTSPWEIGEHSHPHHELIIHLNPGTKVERKIDKRFQHEHINDGDIVLIPAGVPHQSLWDSKNEFIVISLTPELIFSCAWESVNLDSVELIPQFAQADPLTYAIGLNLKAEFELDSNSSQLYVESLTSTLCFHLIQKYTSREPKLHSCIGGLTNDKLKLTIEYINDNLDCKLKLLEIAAQINMSPHYFCRLFKQSMGISPYQYIIQQRLKLARKLLKQRKLYIAQIALQCGFSTQSNLYKAFFKHFGITPKAYQIENS